MSHFILLPVTGRDGDTAVFTVALSAARLLSGHLAFLHVRPDPRQEVAALSTSDFGMGTGIDAMIAEQEQEADAREQAAARAWKAFCRRESVTLADRPGCAGISAEWISETGSLPAWFATHGRSADLVVTGRFQENGVVALDLMESALMDTGRPVLIAGTGDPGPLDGVVAIAWKDTPEAARAVAAAAPFIRAARLVIILAVEEANEPPDRSPQRLLHRLRWHNPNTCLETLKRDGRTPVEVLLEAAVRAKAGLLVMGGYGHTRLREAVFGGFTRAVLEQAPLPVLISH